MGSSGLAGPGGSVPFAWASLRRARINSHGLVRKLLADGNLGPWEAEGLAWCRPAL